MNTDEIFSYNKKEIRVIVSIYVLKNAMTSCQAFSLYKENPQIVWGFNKALALSLQKNVLLCYNRKCGSPTAYQNKGGRSNEGHE